MKVWKAFAKIYVDLWYEGRTNPTNTDGVQGADHGFLVESQNKHHLSLTGNKIISMIFTFLDVPCVTFEGPFGGGGGAH